MRIAKTYSHLNGLEYLLVNAPRLWSEIESVTSEVEVDETLSEKLTSVLLQCGWASTTGWSAQSEPAACDAQPTYLVKERVAIEIAISVSFPISQLPLARHLASYVRDEIDVGIEILAMKSMQSSMSSGPGYYEGELYNVIRNGRGVPAVPLVMIGVVP